MNEQTYDYLTTTGDELHARYMDISLKEEELEMEQPISKYRTLLRELDEYRSVMNKQYEDIKRKLGQLQHLKERGNNEHGTYNYVGDIVADLAELQEEYDGLSMRKIEIDDIYPVVYDRVNQ